MGFKIEDLGGRLTELGNEVAKWPEPIRHFSDWEISCGKHWSLSGGGCQLYVSSTTTWIPGGLLYWNVIWWVIILHLKGQIQVNIPTFIIRQRKKKKETTVVQHTQPSGTVAAPHTHKVHTLEDSLAL